MIQHYPLLQRNLLYTTVTRAKRLAVLVGSPKAIGIAVRNQEVRERHTAPLSKSTWPTGPGPDRSREEETMSDANGTSEKLTRAALYARVSTDEQVNGYSLDAQRRAFKGLVDGRGWTVHREYVEEGRSAHTDGVRKRPVFVQAIDDAEAGRYDVLVVHKIDRFSRKRRITDEYFERLSSAGVGFVSIQEQMDFSTPMVKFALGMLGSLAQFHSDNPSEEVKKGLHERRLQGLYNGLLPFGAAKGKDGVPVPHPDTSPGLKMAFELAALGKSDATLPGQ